MDVSGKSVLLTGGSAGIGRELARQLKAKGARVAITGRNRERLDFMRAEGFEAIEANLSSDAGVDALIADLGEREIDILVNNAGQGVDHDFREEQPEPIATDGCIYANLNAPIRLITALMPRLRKRPEATIVNVTSASPSRPAREARSIVPPRRVCAVTRKRCGRNLLVPTSMWSKPCRQWSTRK